MLIYYSYLLAYYYWYSSFLKYILIIYFFYKFYETIVQELYFHVFEKFIGRSDKVFKPLEAGDAQI